MKVCRRRVLASNTLEREGVGEFEDLGGGRVGVGIVGLRVWYRLRTACLTNNRWLRFQAGGVMTKKLSFFSFYLLHFYFIFADLAVCLLLLALELYLIIIMIHVVNPK